MVARRLVVVGGSAGSHRTLLALAAGLPAGLPAPVLVAIHARGDRRSRLPTILSRAGGLPAAQACDGDPLLPGRILVARPGAHLLVHDGTVTLGFGPRVNRVRPAIDLLLASAVRAAGSAVVAVILSGMLDDGAVGAAMVAQAGGHVVVEDPAQAQYPSMPLATLSAVPTAQVVGAQGLAGVVHGLTTGQRAGGGTW